MLVQVPVTSCPDFQISNEGQKSFDTSLEENTSEIPTKHSCVEGAVSTLGETGA